MSGHDEEFIEKFQPRLLKCRFCDFTVPADAEVPEGSDPVVFDPEMEHLEEGGWVLMQHHYEEEHGKPDLMSDEIFIHPEAHAKRLEDVEEADAFAKVLPFRMPRAS